MKLEDAVVVVTGASSGIGRATVQGLVRAGSTVVAVARREDALHDVADEFDGASRRRLHLEVADVTDAASLERIAADTVGRYGRLDGWVNNAAVNQYGRFEELPLEEWRRVVETNLFGYVHGARAALPWFREQGHGVIVNVGSVLSKVPTPMQSAYVVSKHAVRGLTEVLRQETQDVDGIRLALVMPGPVDTPLFRDAANRTGQRIEPPGPIIDARRVAAAIISNLVRPRREVPVGAASSRMGLAFMRVVPGATERVAGRTMGAAHLGDEAAAPTAGNVFEPATSGASVDGGWKTSHPSAPGRRLVALGGLTAVAAVTAVGVKRRTG